MSIAVSVIVPAYNAEKTVGKTLDSLLGQTLKNIEILVVDDGSKDATRQVISQYVQKDSRVRLLPKDINEGLSAARNTGAAQAQGAYIGFVDSDDWCEPDMFEKMYQASAKADVVVSGFFHDSLDDDGNLVVQTLDQTGENAVVSERKDIISWAAKLDGKRLFAFTCNKIYKTQFFRDTGVLFEKQTLIEDYLFNCKIWGKIQKLSMVDGAYYHYIKFSKEALTQKFLPDYFEIINKRYVLMRDMFEKEGLFSGEAREIICNMHVKHVLAGMVRNFNTKSNYTAAQRKAKIKEMLDDANCRQAMQFAVGKRKQEKVSNFIFKTRSVFLNYLFAKLIFKMQNSKSKLFDKLK